MRNATPGPRRLPTAIPPWGKGDQRGADMSGQTDLLLEQFTVGDRVKLHPATDRAMRGDRFGMVVKLGRRYVHVELDRSGDVRPFAPENVIRL